MFTVSVAFHNSAFCTVRIASTVVFQNHCKEVFINIQVLMFVMRTSAGLRPFREQDRISWCAWKRIFSNNSKAAIFILLKVSKHHHHKHHQQHHTWQKSTSVPILVMQCSISEMVSTSTSWLHLVGNWYWVGLDWVVLVLDWYRYWCLQCSTSDTVTIKSWLHLRSILYPPFCIGDVVLLASEMLEKIVFA